jgi:hypothetical protein
LKSINKVLPIGSSVAVAAALTCCLTQTCVSKKWVWLSKRRKEINKNTLNKLLYMSDKT